MELSGLQTLMCDKLICYFILDSYESISYQTQKLIPSYLPSLLLHDLFWFVCFVFDGIMLLLLISISLPVEENSRCVLGIPGVSGIAP